MYVSLEPYAHAGKTGACLDLIDPEIFKRIVIAEKDPNEKASGSIEKIKRSGIEVEVGLLKQEARASSFNNPTSTSIPLRFIFSILPDAFLFGSFSAMTILLKISGSIKSEHAPVLPT